MASSLSVVRTFAAFAAIIACVGLVVASRNAAAQSLTPGVDAAASSSSARLKRRAATKDVPSMIPHYLWGRADCLVCHGAEGNFAMPEDHKDRTDVMCLGCHVPTVSPQEKAPDDQGAPAIAMVSNDYCFACHSNPDLKIKLSGGKDLPLFVDRDAYGRAIHGRRSMSCIACHPTNQSYPHQEIAAASARELNRGIVQQRCGMCHKEVFRKFKESVHGKALLEENNVDVPSCTDCHGVHGTLREPHDALFRLESPSMCSACHADPKRMDKYNISTSVTKTYFNDFHGASIRLERNRDPSFKSYKPVCYDCHGIHDIKKIDDPASSVIKANLIVTCQRCHKQADVKFPASWTSHYIPDKAKWPVVYYVNIFYKIMIPVVIGGMVIYILLEVLRNAINKLRGGKHP
ncbi:MAG: cytochrome c3 family protein [Myxococcales bacterium]